MKNSLKLESLGWLLLISTIYFHRYPGGWGLYLGLFFVPDISFIFYLAGKKTGAIAYNIVHHQGLLAIVVLLGFFLQQDLLCKVGLIFLAHSGFDRVAGYGLKYFDSFEHTHLGWIGKRKYLDEAGS